MSFTYQCCPVCQGTGLVSRPPYIAGDQTYWTDSGTGPYPCKPCGGQGLIQVPIGPNPAYPEHTVWRPVLGDAGGTGDLVPGGTGDGNGVLMVGDKE